MEKTICLNDKLPRALVLKRREQTMGSVLLFLEQQYYHMLMQVQLSKQT